MPRQAPVARSASGTARLFQLPEGRGPVAVRDGHAPVLAEGLGGDTHTGRHLAPLVLRAVDEADDLVDYRGLEALRHQFGRGAVAFHVALQDRVELLVGR